MNLLQPSLRLNLSLNNGGHPKAVEMMFVISSSDSGTLAINSEYWQYLLFTQSHFPVLCLCMSGSFYDRTIFFTFTDQLLS